MKRSVDPLYDQFSAPERVALVIGALGRQDINEVDRLIDTCPIKTYRQPDAAYSEAIRMLRVLALETRVWLLEKRAAGGMVFALMAGAQDHMRDETFSRLSDKLMAADVMTISIWTAWSSFCERLGIDPDAAMDPYDKPGIGLKRGLAFEFLGVTEELDPDPEVVERIGEFYARAWRKVEQYQGWKRAA